uniref:Transposase n=1 Tax=Caenorhabditis japonica TaxID=281687 RepID=A0A8R1HV68_CAEJA
MFRRQRPLWKTYRTEQRTATRRREGNARCNYARAGDHVWLQSPNHQQSSSRSRLPARWVHHALSPYQMQARVTACQSLLLTPQRKEFLADLVTGNESWVVYNNDTQRAVWIPRGEDPPVQPKANLYEKKCLLSCFWDAKGMLYYELLPQGRTINSTTYSNQLASLALALQEKCPRRSAVHLLHDNARPYVAKATQEKLQELNWDTVPHPPYLLDIAPSDYHLFRPLKLFLKEEGHRQPPPRAMSHSCN